MTPEQEKQEKRLRIAAVMGFILALITGIYIWSGDPDTASKPVISTHQIQ